MMDQFLARPTLAEGTEQGTTGDSPPVALAGPAAARSDALADLGNDWELKEISLEMTVTDGGRERRVELRDSAAGAERKSMNRRWGAIREDGQRWRLSCAAASP